MNRAASVCISLLLMAISVVTRAADPSINSPCSKSVFDVVASIAYVEPKESRVPAINLRNGTKMVLQAGDCLAGGEQIGPLPEHIVRVDVFFGGERVILGSKEAYTVPSGLPQYSKIAQSFIGNLFRLPVGTPAFQERETVTRRGDGTEEKQGSVKVPMMLRPIESLRGLPTQTVMPDATIVTGWRHGKPPFSCVGLSATGDAVTVSPPLSVNWCTVTFKSTNPARIAVRDSQQSQYGWNVDMATWSDIPRPPWITSAPQLLSSGDRAAWGIWIWHNASANWRLQALSLLHSASFDSWLAGYILRSILDETPLPRAEITLQ